MIIYLLRVMVVVDKIYGKVDDNRATCRYEA